MVLKAVEVSAEEDGVWWMVGMDCRSRDLHQNAFPRTFFFRDLAPFGTSRDA